MKNLLFTLIITISSTALFAQVPQERNRERTHQGNQQKNERIESMKVGFLTDKLELTTKDAQEFWPIYNEFHKKKKELKKKWRQFESGEVKLSDLEDKQLEEVMMIRMDNNIKEAELEKEYHNKFVKTIGIQKTARLYKAEVEFKRELLRNLKEKR